MICDGFGPPFWEPRGSLWGSFGRQSLQPGACMSIFRFFLVRLKTSEKGAQSSPKRSLFRGGRHGASVVNGSKNLVFRVLEQAPFLDNFWQRFGLHFGSVLGAQVDTILRFGRPGVQIGCPEAVGWKRVCFVVSRVPK